MATHDYIISNASGAAVRSDLNNALSAIVSNNSSATEPATTYAYQMWADTGSTPAVMKLRDSTNSSWITLYNLDGSSLPTASATEIVFNDAGADLDFRIEGDNQANLFYVDAGNDRIGIGTNAPQRPLHIDGTEGVLRLTSTASGNDGFEVGIGSSSQAFLWQAENSYIQIATNNTEVARIDSSGNVGIGTDNPQVNVDIAPNTSSAILRVHARTDTSAEPAIELMRGANTTFGADTYGDYRIKGSGGNLILEKGADGSTTEVLRIDGGRLLVGTSTAAGPTKVDIVGNGTSGTGSGVVQIRRGSDALLSDNELGYLAFGDTISGGYQRALIGAYADGTGGAGDLPTRMSFFTTPDNSATPLERMRITQSGEVFIGNVNTVTGEGLTIFSTSDNDNTGSFYVRNNNTALAACVAAFATGTNSTSTSNILIRFGINYYATASGTITTNGGGAVAFGTVSDERVKENIVNLPSQWENIKNLRPVEFDYIESQGGEHQIGFVAQEFETVYPDAVSSSPLWVNGEESSDEERLTITGWSKTEARLVKALQEAIAKIETLEAKVAALESA